MEIAVSLQEIRQRLRLENEPKERIDPRAWKVWTINGSFNFLILMGLALAFNNYAVGIFFITEFHGMLAYAVALLYAPYGMAVAPWLAMRFWRYEVREEELETQHGIFIIRRHLIPMIRVQHVDTEHGPLMRYFGLATLYVTTAATRFPIPALPKERAEELRGEISALARVSDEDV